MILRTCPSCGASFTPKRHWHKFCSTKCRYRNFEVNKRHGMSDLRIIMHDKQERVASAVYLEKWLLEKKGNALLIDEG